MFKVECPGCKAPYQVDERRIPSSGLKMRCPKCGTSFKVDPPADARRTGPSPVLGGVLGVPDSAPPPALAPPDATKGTMLGVAPQQRSSAMKGTMMGVAPAGANVPVALTAPTAPIAPTTAAAKPPPPARPPVPRPGVPRPNQAAPAPPPAAPPAAAAADLPAPVAARAPTAGIDLPSVAGPRATAPATVPSPGRFDLDLPSATGRSSDLDLPSPRAPAPVRLQSPFEAPVPGPELDLPSLGGAFPGDEAELPAPAPPRGGIDLPSVPRAQPSASEPSGADLPSLGGTGLPATSGAGLPARPPVPRQPTGGSGIELPSPRRSPAPSVPDLLDIDLPLSAGELKGSIELDLPLPSAGGLPSPAAGLPVASAAPPATISSLPPALGGAFAPSPPSFGGASAAAPFAEIELPPSDSLPPPAPAFGSNFGEVDLLGAAPSPRSPLSDADLEVDPFGEAPLPGPASGPTSGAARSFGAAPAPAQRQTGGGVAYGEVSLDAGGPAQEVALDAALPPPPSRGEDDMEFGAVPQEAPPGVSTTSVSARAPAPAPKPAPTRPKRRWAPRLLVGGFVLGLAGAALSLVPSVGPFGVYFVMDQLKAGEYRELVASTAKAANAALASDVYPDAARAAGLVEAAHQSARRAKGLSALSAYVTLVSELRFGPDSPSHARATVRLAELAEETEVDMLDLARAAQAATDGQIARARQLLGAAEARGKSLEAAALRAELELRAKDAKAALAAWEAAKSYGDSPRIQYGLARAKLAAGDGAGAAAHAEAVLAQHPQHVGSRLLVARLSSGSREDESRALSLLQSVIEDAKSSSPGELVSAYTLLGGLHLGRSRISAAEAAFGEALKIDPKAPRALVGLGDALYRAGRYSEAEARFKAGAEADPDDLQAKIGVAKSKLSLERVQDASSLLKKLRETNPTSPLVGYWYGRVQEALGARDAAEAAYRDVLKAAPSDPASADVYIALALLLNQLGRPEDAQKTLDTARELMPAVTGVWRALGDVAQSQGRYKEALAHFQKAAALDPEDLGAKFRIGGALRRDGQFEAASKAFDEVAAIDKDYPGLALERGLLFEASGHSDEALKQYEDALAKAPSDPDLMLRVGCGKVAANRPEQAEELLRKVLSQRPSSAETHHCLGRALLVQGTRLADALRMLERAVELDPNRAEYLLYVGWAANEAGNVPKAEKALAEALRLDQGLADAYWQRGVLRQRQGAVRDAISDLTRALQLRPSRHEAHAALADAFYDLGREADALREWKLAIQALPDNATWRFRYGKLLAANHQNEAAIEQLGKALGLIENVEPPPRWRWEAHHALARALGPNPEAVKHWESFLRLGPRDSPYRADAKAHLEKAGRPWTGD